jgi:serine protease
MNKLRRIAVVFTMLAIIAPAAQADNPLKGNSAQRKFKLPEGVKKQDYLANTIIVKIDASKRADCSRSAIAIPALAESFGKLGIESLQAKFPNHTPPPAQKNLEGRALTDLSLIYEVKYSSSASIEEAINELLKSPDVIYAEPHYIYKLDYTPNDPDTTGSKNYYLEITKTYQAWDVTKGDTSVVIGIVDSGSDLDHPDLAANMQKNYADPVNGIDDDADGYIDNFIGWDLAGADFNIIVGDNDANAKGNNNNHGSHVSGDASAVTDNGTGVSGVGFKCRLLPVKCSADNDTRGPGGTGFVLTGYEGIVYAADHGADVINCSWGGAGGGSFGQEAINYATDQGSLVVAAAGNDAQDVGHFPSAYKNVLSVASTTSADKRSNFSNYGYSIDVCSPGSGIYSTLYNNSYASLDGTSMASPVAAGAAALVKSVYPSYNALQVGEKLRVTCDDIYTLNPGNFLKDKLGKGRINVLRAVTESSPSVRVLETALLDHHNGSMLIDDTITMSNIFMNYLDPTANLTITLTTTSTAVSIINGTINQGVLTTLNPAAGVNPFTFKVLPAAPENAKVSFKVTFDDGTYKDFQYITLEVNLSSLNIDVNNVSSTATGVGRVGFRNGDATGGLGFIYKGINMLYEASFMIGKSATQVSNNARTDGQTPDEHFVVMNRVTRTAQSQYDFFSSGKFNDANAPAPLNISVSHRELATIASPHDKYIIFEYILKNENATDLTGIYPGMFFDWDIKDAAKNRVAWDNTNQLAYAFSTVDTLTDPWSGVKLLTTTTPAAPAFFPCSHSIPGDIQEGGFTTAEKYQTLSSGIFNDSLGFAQPTGVDIMYAIGAGPYTIPAGAEIKFAVAIIGGDNVADLQASAQAAQNKYNVPLVGINNSNGSTVSDLKNYPNPATNYTNIFFNLSEESKTTLTIYDELGREVKKVFENNLYQGPYQINVDVKELPKGIYFYTLKTDKGQATGKLVIQ